MDLHGAQPAQGVDFTRDEFLSLVDLGDQLRKEKGLRPQEHRLAGRTSR